MLLRLCAVTGAIFSGRSISSPGCAVCEWEADVRNGLGAPYAAANPDVVGERAGHLEEAYEVLPRRSASPHEAERQALAQIFESSPGSHSALPLISPGSDCLESTGYFVVEASGIFVDCQATTCQRPLRRRKVPVLR